MVSKSYLMNLRNTINDKPPGSVYNGNIMLNLIDEILTLRGWEEKPLIEADLSLDKPGMVIEECDT